MVWVLIVWNFWFWSEIILLYIGIYWYFLDFDKCKKKGVGRDVWNIVVFGVVVVFFM